jgi:hypothetical protein
MSSKEIARAIHERIAKQNEAIAARFEERRLNLGKDPESLARAVERCLIEKFDIFALETVPFAPNLQQRGRIDERYRKVLEDHAHRIVDHDLAQFGIGLPPSRLEHLRERLVQRLDPRIRYWLAKVSYTVMDTPEPSVVPPPVEPLQAGKPAWRSHKYQAIDEALKAIAESRPSTQKEVFEQLDGRRVGTPRAEPFLSARGWVRGLGQDEAAARAVAF